jgi:hypothetical protein
MPTLGAFSDTEIWYAVLMQYLKICSRDARHKYSLESFPRSSSQKSNSTERLDLLAQPRSGRRICVRSLPLGPDTLSTFNERGVFNEAPSLSLHSTLISTIATMSAAGGGVDIMERYWAMPPVTRLVRDVAAVELTTDHEQVHHHGDVG